MLTDAQTNFLYLPDKLLKRRGLSGFVEALKQVLETMQIPFAWLPDTRDIWAVDYMPVQTAADRFVQFHYWPDYIRKVPAHHRSVSDVPKMLRELEIEAVQCTLKVDGGNVVRATDKVIMTERVFRENEELERSVVIAALREALQTDQLVFIPWNEEADIIGHADGMVRFLDEHTVLMNDYQQESALAAVVAERLRKACLEIVPFAYQPYRNKKEHHAHGIYCNYLHMEQGILLPVFGQREDEQAVFQTEQLFPHQQVAVLNCRDIAFEGGVLNCVTWNIQRHA